jgi:sugar fermentation stimulation protein A
VHLGEARIGRRRGKLPVMSRAADFGDPCLLLTEPLRSAHFLERTNRFRVTFRDRQETGVAYLANSGRLEEILLPGAEILLASRPNNRLAWEALGARYQSRWPGDRPRTVFLNSSMCNRLAGELLKRKLIENLREWDIVRAEQKLGASRIDFLLGQGERRYYLEVKSVTLCEHGVALFPDACTERGRRHLIELASARPPDKSGVLFLVQGEASCFLPDFHNDLTFARTLHGQSERFDVLAFNLNPVVTSDNRLLFCEKPRRVPVAWDLVERGVEDSGVYMLALQIDQEQMISIGGRGEVRFAAGWYIYAGSARRNLTKRVGWHLRRRKRFHYHIDYLRARASAVRAFPVRGSRVEECRLASLLRAAARSEVRGFGCSDCDCPSHLFYFRENPAHLPEYQKLLVSLRHRLGGCDGR